MVYFGWVYPSGYCHIYSSNNINTREKIEYAKVYPIYSNRIVFDYKVIKKPAFGAGSFKGKIC
jgi:hypothetical protein